MPDSSRISKSGVVEDRFFVGFPNIKDQIGFHKVSVRDKLTHGKRIQQVILGLKSSVNSIRIFAMVPMKWKIYASWQEAEICGSSVFRLRSSVLSEYESWRTCKGVDNHLNSPNMARKAGYLNPNYSKFCIFVWCGQCRIAAGFLFIYFLGYPDPMHPQTLKK